MMANIMKLFIYKARLEKQNRLQVGRGVLSCPCKHQANLQFFISTATKLLAKY